MTDEKALEDKLRERRAKPKRFYKEASAAPAEEGGWSVLLDGRAVRSPSKRRLVVPSEALARAIAAEWDAQAEEIDAAAMPLTALACTALDRAGPQREEVVEQLLAYGGNDLLCYWAEHPRELVARQEQLWQPLLEWVRERYDAHLEVCRGIIHKEQPARSREALAKAVEGLDDYRLAALSSAVSVSGSLVVALALVDGRLEAGEAFDAAELDASYQIERWGEDAEASARRGGVRRDLVAVSEFLHLLK